MKEKKDTAALGSGDAQKETRALVVPQTLEDLFAETAGAGLEDFKGSDFAIPFLTILQKNSPQVEEGNAKYVPGAKAGMVFNTVTQELFDTAVLPTRPEPEGLGVVPAAHARVFVEWVPRDDGGGFIGQHDPESDVVKEAEPSEKGNKLVTAGGNHLVDTVYRYVVVNGPSGAQWAVIALSSTQLKKARLWASLIGGMKVTVKGTPQTPPVFGQYYRLKTVLESNDQGSWYGWKIESAGLVPSLDLFNAAKTYREAVTSGAIRATPPPQDSDEKPAQTAASTKIF